MLTPVVIRFFSLDADPIAAWIAPDPRRVHISIDVFFSLDHQPNGEIFTLNVITSDLLEKDEWKRSKYQLIQECYDWSNVQAFVHSIAARCAGNTWQEIAMKLSEHLHWEFQDYEPCTSEPGTTPV